MTGKLGFGYNKEIDFCLFGACSSSAKKFFTTSHHFTGSFGDETLFVEVGIGGTIISGNADQKYILYPIVGLKIMPLRFNKVNFRIFGQVPFTELKTEEIIFSPVGLSLGISF